MAINRYGWIPDIPDARDDNFRLAAPANTEGMPVRADVRDLVARKVYNQRYLGSCGPHTAMTLLRAARERSGRYIWDPSPLFIYFVTRKLQNTVGFDSGVSFREMWKAVNAFGYCKEELWPYDPANFRKPPPRKVFKAAFPAKGISYHSVEATEAGLKKAILDRLPVAFGMTIYSGFDGKDRDTTRNTGYLTPPGPGAKTLGGHALTLVGYDDMIRRGDHVGHYLIRNSYGPKFGLRGYFWAPYTLIHDPARCRDFWAVNDLGSEDPK